MNLPTLYKKTKTGKIQSWTVWADGSTIYTKHGQIDGKQQTIAKEAEGKNIGKSNETTPERQAELEAESMHRHRLDKGYFLTIEETDQKVFLPMLAQDYTKLRKPITFPVDVQPKLDGVRCMAYWKDGKIRLMSRGGKDYDVKHISEELKAWLPSNVVLDGELYVHGEQLQNIVRLVKKHRDGLEGSIRLDYKVYDMFCEDRESDPWKSRKVDLQNMFFDDANIFDVKSTLVTDEEHLFSCLKEYEELGYEGIIIRKLDGPYALGQRSRDLLKLKNFKDGEYKIVGFTQAKGIDKGTVVWTCITPEGLEFNVRPMGTREQRKEWFENGEKYIGKEITVKYQTKSELDIPLFPVGISIRLAEDL